MTKYLAIQTHQKHTELKNNGQHHHIRETLQYVQISIHIDIMTAYILFMYLETY